MLAGPAAAETTNNSAPRAQATSNNTNQSVQFNNNGAPSRQHFSAGHSCNGSTLVITPFHLEAHADPIPGEDYTRMQNMGAQLSINIPLDGSITEMCKELARKRLRMEQQKLDKEQLDYHLVRALRCAELYEKGFMIHPEAKLASLCSDVVSIDVYRKSVGLSLGPSQSSSTQSEKQVSAALLNSAPPMSPQLTQQQQPQPSPSQP